MEVYAEIMEVLITKHNEQIKEMENKIAKALKRNETLKADRDNKTKLFEVLLKARGDRCKQLEEEIREKTIERTRKESRVNMEEENMKFLADLMETPVGNLSPPIEPMETFEIDSEGSGHSNQSNHTLDQSDIYVDDKWEGFRFTSETIVDTMSLTLPLNTTETSEAKIRRMIKSVHDFMGKATWNSKEIVITRSFKKDTVSKYFITCPDCLKKISTGLSSVSTTGKCGNFSLSLYKRHIKFSH